MVGIYGIFRRSDDKCMYVGESKDINGRIKAHLDGKTRNLFNKNEFYGEMIEQHFIDDKNYRLDREAYWIEQLNPELNEIRDRHHSDEYKEKLRQFHLGKYHSEESKKKIKENHADFSGNKNPMYGKNAEDYMTPEAIIEKRKKQSEAMKGNKNNLGKKWINNGTTNKFVNQDDLDKYIQDGWKLGLLRCKRNS